MRNRHQHAQAAVSQAVYEAVKDRRITSASVYVLCGGISQMTLWRWMQDPQLGFPEPIYIGRRRYWRESEILEWLDAQPSRDAAT